MLTLKTIRAKARHWRAEREARDRLAADGIIAACRAMRTLNRFAKESRAWRPVIYAAKGELIHQLYRYRWIQDACEVTEQVHRQRCLGYWNEAAKSFRGCMGASCLKCGGRGYRSRYRLFFFRFVIRGEPFAWHYPAQALSWTPTVHRHSSLTAEPTDYFYRSPSAYEAEVLLATVRRYLQLQGVTIEAPPANALDIGVLDAIASDVTRIRLRITQGRAA